MDCMEFRGAAPYQKTCLAVDGKRSANLQYPKSGRTWAGGKPRIRLHWPSRTPDTRPTRENTKMAGTGTSAYGRALDAPSPFHTKIRHLVLRTTKGMSGEMNFREQWLCFDCISLTFFAAWRRLILALVQIERTPSLSRIGIDMWSS
jgi:hypothetical protein